MSLKIENIILTKSKDFAIRIIRMYQFLQHPTNNNMPEYVLAKQVLRSGTSIGANIREARRAQSTADFLAKLYIALKEADETEYWIELLYSTDYISEQMYGSMQNDCEELLKLLTSIIKTTQSNNSKFIIQNS